MPTDPCGNVLPNQQPVIFDQIFQLPTICADVDGTKMYVIPFVLIGDDEPLEYRDELGNKITGTVTATSPCDCPCGDCP